MRFRVSPLLAAATAAVLSVIAVVAHAPRPATAQQTENVELFRGCNNVSLTWPNGTATSVVAAAITPASALQSIWRFNNVMQTFQGFSAQFPAQSDLQTVNRIDAVFVCMSGSGTMARPVLTPGGGTTVAATMTPTTTSALSPAVAGQTRITYINSTAPRGSAVTVTVQSTPNTLCSGTVMAPGSQAVSIGSATANSAGVAVLYWQVPTNSPTGNSVVRVTCGPTSDQATIMVV
jgi:hypothetical protein